jgi:hypothetical protein
MRKLGAVIASGLILISCPYSLNAHARNHSLSYQEAVWMCGNGNLQACEVMYAYDIGRSRESVAAHRDP